MTEPVPLKPPSRRPVLVANEPLKTARKFLAAKFTFSSYPTLYHHFDEWRRWNGSHWQTCDEPFIRSMMWKYMESCDTYSAEGLLGPFEPTRHRVTDAIDGLRAICNLPRATTPPCWLTRNTHPRPDPTRLIACANGLLEVETGKLIEHTPEFFNINANPFDFDPDAACPEWLRFLDDLWPEDDQAQIEALQEWFGYLLTVDTSQHKILMLIGPKRGGKGTIGRILTALLGQTNVCAPTLASLGRNFGPWVLIGKQLALIADARLSGRADQHIIAERLLSISGEDIQTIDRKFREPWSGRLPTRFVVLSNELPRIADASAALPSRFIILELTQSFLGREDVGLTDRLLEELPGILNWGIAGYHRFAKRGHFQQPAEGAALVQELEDLSSPVGAFIRQRCVVNPAAEVGIEALFDAWRSWCEFEGRAHPGNKQVFGRDLRALVPGLKIPQHPRRYRGIGLTEVFVPNSNTQGGSARV